jgi:Tfp pilus assembly protein PilZ
MVQDRRKHKRWPKRVRVRYWVRGKPDKVFSAYTRDVSEGGAFLQTNSPFRQSSRLQIEFITEHGGFLIEGEVARSISYPRELQQIKTGGMGVRFVPIRELLQGVMPSATSTGATSSEEANDVIERAAVGALEPTVTGDLKRRRSLNPTFIHSNATDDPILSGPLQTRDQHTTGSGAGPSHTMSVDQPAAQKEAEPTAGLKSRAYLTSEMRDRTLEPKKALGTKVPPIYPVQFQSREHFEQVFEKDLKFGGLFISTEKPAKMDEEIELRIEIPEVPRSLLVKAQVVHVMDPQTGSGESNLLAGMGVHFLDTNAIARLQELVSTVKS